MDEQEYREDDHGTLWYTIRQTAAKFGRSVQTIYAWERRGILTDPRTDEYGRRIYTLAQIARAERAVRPRAERILNAA